MFSNIVPSSMAKCEERKKFTYLVKIFAAKLCILPNRNSRNWNCEKVYCFSRHFAMLQKMLRRPIWWENVFGKYLTDESVCYFRKIFPRRGHFNIFEAFQIGFKKLDWIFFSLLGLSTKGSRQRRTIAYFSQIHNSTIVFESAM